MYKWSNTIFGINTIFAPAGVLTALVITTPSGNFVLAIIIYLIGCIVTAFAGFIITLFGYSKVTTVGLQEMKILYSKNSTYKLWQQILLSISFITIIAVFIYWICVYYKMPLNQRKEIACI